MHAYLNLNLDLNQGTIHDLSWTILMFLKNKF